MSTKVSVKGHIHLESAHTWEDAMKQLPEFLRTLQDYDCYLELDDRQIHPDGSVVMLVDPTGEIETEGPAKVDGYSGCGGYIVTIPEEHRTDPDDVDGLREVDEGQMVPITEYKS